MNKIDPGALFRISQALWDGDISGCDPNEARHAAEVLDSILWVVENNQDGILEGFVAKLSEIARQGVLDEAEIDFHFEYGTGDEYLAIKNARNADDKLAANVAFLMKRDGISQSKAIKIIAGDPNKEESVLRRVKRSKSKKPRQEG